MKLTEVLDLDAPPPAPTDQPVPPAGDEFESLKTFLRDNKTALKVFIRLNEIYRNEGLPFSKEAKGLLESLLTLHSGSQDTPFGIQRWDPNELAFARFLDQIGEQPLGEFLGIQDMGALPGANLETEADSIRNTALKDNQKEEGPVPQLSSVQTNYSKGLTENRVTSLPRGSSYRHLAEALRSRSKRSKT